MKQNKQKLKEKLVSFQKEIAELRRSVIELTSEKERGVDGLLLKMIELMDYFETEEANISDDIAKSTKMEQANSTERILKTAEKKLTRILKSSGVKKIHFEDNLAAPELCRVVDTLENDALKDGTIMEIIKNGYAKRGCRIPLRKAEVITVASSS